MRVNMLRAGENKFEEYLNDLIKKGWKPKFESYNVVKGYSTMWHYILLVKK